jgi:hypothetical protein
MSAHHVKAYAAKVPLPKTEQLALKLASVAADKSRGKFLQRKPSHF